MTWWEAAILGIIQGVTEFLPVSSSGHLVIAQTALGVSKSSITFDVMVHLGSLVAVLAALRADWLPMVRGALGSRSDAEGRRRILLVLIGSVPVGIVGLLFKDFLEPLFQSARAAGTMLLVTGLVLWFADKTARQAKNPGGRRDLSQVSIQDAVWIGCGQALAVLPGLSRSGTTIAAGMVRGIDRESAARFAFLLSIPAILGATVLELPALFSGASDAPALLIGAAAAAISGYFAIATFLRFLRSGSLIGFAVYTWVVGLIVLILYW